MAYSDEQLRQAVDAVFGAFDADNSGTLDPNEVYNLISAALKNMDPPCNREPTKEEVQALVQATDTSGDGKISKMELFNIFKKVMSQ